MLMQSANVNSSILCGRADQARLIIIITDTSSHLKCRARAKQMRPFFLASREPQLLVGSLAAMPGHSKVWLVSAHSTAFCFGCPSIWPSACSIAFASIKKYITILTGILRACELRAWCSCGCLWHRRHSNAICSKCRGSIGFGGTGGLNLRLRQACAFVNGFLGIVCINEFL